MKKLFVVFVLVLAVTFSGCAFVNTDPEKTPSFSTPTPEPSTPQTTEGEEVSDKGLVDNITFRRGENADGEVLFTSDALEKISVHQDNSGEIGILFTFTEKGKQLLSQHSADLASNGEKMSIWIGEEPLFCAPVLEGLYAGEMLISSGDYSMEDLHTICNKFYGIAPAPTPTPMIADEVLNEILETVTDTFTYEGFELLVSDGQLKRISGPYKNTEKTAITSTQTLIDLGTKEAPESYLYNTLAYDANHKFWYVSFKKTADAEISYVVILSSEGITVTIYTLP